ncbi:MAG: tetratricopeptide repeat protein [Bacteroidales bacterium]|jgi:tetratricopeptide (TPR) repeat protein|nr:tetratricopeptide repeat protein [Bacteroidales bacterium]
MSKNTKKDDSSEQLENVENALSKTERYIEENQKSLTIIVFAIAIIIGGYFAYQKFYLQPKENVAHAQMFVAEQYFAKDSFNLAINGDGNYLGFVDIVDEFGMTKAGNLSNYYLGISYLKLGQYENAIKYLKQFETDDILIEPIAYGAIGDAYLELDNKDDALSFYDKAVYASDNKYTSPKYLMKVGYVNELLKKYDDALEAYEEIENNYSESSEGSQVEKYIAKVKVLMAK